MIVLRGAQTPPARDTSLKIAGPSVLNQQLGEKNVSVINESLGGRTTIFDDFSVAADRNGGKILPTILDSHMPLDLIIIMLGTNDLKNYICGNVAAITRGVGRLVEIIKNHKYHEDFTVPQILIVSPPHAVKTNDPVFHEIFAGAVEKSARFQSKFSALAQTSGCYFFDAAKNTVASPVDGVHLDAKNTRSIGINIAPTVAKILKM